MDRKCVDPHNLVLSDPNALQAIKLVDVANNVKDFLRARKKIIARIFFTKTVTLNIS